MEQVLKSVKNLELTPSVKEHLDETWENYRRYIEKLLLLGEKELLLFLETLKTRELLNNQETELQQSFLIEVYLNYQRMRQTKDSIDVAMNALEDGNVTMDEIRRLHRIVIKGSQDDDPKNYEYRTDNNKWVGSFGTGGRMDVDYYPPNFEDIPKIMNEILGILNDQQKNPLLNHLLVKPFLVHGMLAYLQPFGNGNTRVSRVLQHAKIWQMTNEELESNLPFPAIYLSKNYLQTRPQYRKLIKEIATEKDEDALNSWLNYNLNRVDEKLYYNGNTLNGMGRIL